MAALENIVGDYSRFLDEILSRVVNEGFELSDFIQVDHMCYRVSSLEDYHRKKTDLESVATLLGEAQVNGRSISTFRLKEPVIHGKWRIDALELPAPKAGSNFKEGLEHIEFVLFDDIPTFLKKYEGKPFNLRAVDRGINPEIGLQLDELTVKFHLLNLPTVVFIENKLNIKDVRDGQ